MVAQAPHLVLGLGLDVQLEGVGARLPVVAEHEVLPDHDAQLVADRVELVGLVVAAAPVADHVHVGVARRLQDAAVVGRGHAIGEAVEGNHVRAFGGCDGFREENEEIYADLLRALDLIGLHLKVIQNPADEIVPLVRRTLELGVALRFVMEEEDERYVYWVEKRGRGCFLQATPIDVSPILSERLFQKVDSVILTSATLAVAGGFVYTEKRLGLAGARGLVIPAISTTASRRCSTSTAVPEPRSPAFAKAAGEEGRAF